MANRLTTKQPRIHDGENTGMYVVLFRRNAIAHLIDYSSVNMLVYALGNRKNSVIYTRKYIYVKNIYVYVYTHIKFIHVKKNKLIDTKTRWAVAGAKGVEGWEK